MQILLTARLLMALVITIDQGLHETLGAESQIFYKIWLITDTPSPLGFSGNSGNWRDWSYPDSWYGAVPLTLSARVDM